MAVIQRKIVSALFCTCFATVLVTVHSGPTDRLSRIVREVYPEIEPENDGNQSQVCVVGDVVYEVDEVVPADQPCLKCRCQPPGVQCETTRCVKKKGCRAVQKPNQCCPDYQCECEFDGKTYANGEKLENQPGEECRVCYCRGGEFQCADVSCYIRNDCEGKQVPGQCCPKYDHCPTRDSTNRTLSNLMETNKIKANTLPSLSSIPKSSESSLKNSTETDNARPSANDSNSISLEIIQVEPDRVIQKPTITIQEIIGSVKEIPMSTSAPKQEEPKGQLIIEEANTTFALADQNSNELFTTDSKPDSSELSEVYQPAPPLKIGDKLLFEERMDVDPETETTSFISEITRSGDEEIPQKILESIEESNLNLPELEQTSTDQPSNEISTIDDLNVASSTHILSLVKRKNTVISSTETASTVVDSSLLIQGDTLFNLDGNEFENITAELNSSLNESVETVSSASANQSEEISELATDGQYKSKEEQYIQNPAYPSIPDIMTRTYEEESKETETPLVVPKEFDQKPLAKILPVVTPKLNKTLPNITNAEWLKSQNNDENLSMINPKASLPISILKQQVESDIDLNPDIETIDASLMETNRFETTSTQSSDSSAKVSLDAVVRSTESLEQSSMEEIERATSQDKKSALVSNESASIEIAENVGPEVDDLAISKIKPSAEETTHGLDDIKVNSEKSSPKIIKLNDTENVNVEELIKNEPSGQHKPQKVATKNKIVEKRNNSPEAESDEVFKQLDRELNADTSERAQTKEEEEMESEQIFKELLDETSKPPTIINPQSRTKEQETLERVSQALAKFALRGSRPTLDTGILGVLTDFFSSQYRSYDSKNK